MTKKNQIINGKKEGYWEEGFSFIKEDNISWDEIAYYDFYKDEKWMNCYSDFWEIPSFLSKHFIPSASLFELDELSQKGNYKSGLKTGKWTISLRLKFMLNLEVEGTFVDDSREGKWKIKEIYTGGYFSERTSEKIIATGNYKKNKKEGNWIWESEVARFDEQNKLFNKIVTRGKGVYKKGNKIGKWIWFHDNGKIHCEEDKFKNGKNEGIVNIYDELGKLQELINYKQGQKHGENKEYYSGVLIFSGYYWKGNQVGINSRFNRVGDLLSLEFNVPNYYNKEENKIYLYKTRGVVCKEDNIKYKAEFDASGYGKIEEIYDNGRTKSLKIYVPNYDRSRIETEKQFDWNGNLEKILVYDERGKILSEKNNKSYLGVKIFGYKI